MEEVLLIHYKISRSKLPLCCFSFMAAAADVVACSVKDL